MVVVQRHPPTKQTIISNYDRRIRLGRIQGFFVGILVALLLQSFRDFLRLSSAGYLLDEHDHVKNDPPTYSKSKQLEKKGAVVVVANNTTNENKNKVTKQYNFTAAICLIVKDGEAYLHEWVDYHIAAVKFQNVYIYDHSEDFELEQWYNQTRDHPIYSKMVIRHFPNDGNSGHDRRQERVYEDCIRRYGRHGPRHDYFALIDADEFLVIQDSDKYSGGIRDVLQEYLVPYGGALTVNWMLIGDSNQSVYAPFPVTKRFQYREKEPEVVIKMIVATKDYRKQQNPHKAKLIKDGTAEHHTTKYPGAVLEYTPAGAIDSERPSDVILLYHYRYNSHKEYIVRRCQRGNLGHDWCAQGGKSIKEVDTERKHILSRAGTVFDDLPWRLLKAAVPKYEMYDAFVDY